MTTLTGKRVTVTIEQKAHALTVFSINEPGRLAVTSGTKDKTAYVVLHNDTHAAYCPCGAYGRCAHKVAVNWHLEALRRAAYTEMFDIYAC